MMHKVHSILLALNGLSQKIAKHPLTIGADVLSAVTHPFKNHAKGAVFVSKAVGIGILTAGMLLFGVPVGTRDTQAQASLPLPPAPEINYITADLYPSWGQQGGWCESGRLFLSASFSAAPE
ncbi:MAG: hypothetical protein M2R45_04298 [Verrucomicrobia subdivision 3 bacterium]|nr:hypothetical protein [Limisphaerales bacterium]MCS1417213.1 hypothetical protein [Limisphaerales bacterium]